MKTKEVRKEGIIASDDSGLVIAMYHDHKGKAGLTRGTLPWMLHEFKLGDEVEIIVRKKDG